MKNNGKLKEYIGFQNMNFAISKDRYPMLAVDLLVDRVNKHEILSFKDGHLACNQFFNTKEDILKTTFTLRVRSKHSNHSSSHSI